MESEKPRHSLPTSIPSGRSREPISVSLAMALRPEIQPQAALGEIVQRGYDTDTVAAICGSLLGARFGCAWIPVERLLDCGRLTAYADALVMRSGLTKDTPEIPEARGSLDDR
jgi:hypothetical protein